MGGAEEGLQNCWAEEGLALSSLGAATLAAPSTATLSPSTSETDDPDPLLSPYNSAHLRAQRWGHLSSKIKSRVCFPMAMEAGKCSLGESLMRR